MYLVSRKTFPNYLLNPHNLSCYDIEGVEFWVENLGKAAGLV